MRVAVEARKLRDPSETRIAQLSGMDANGNEHAFLLVPCNDDDATWQDAPGEKTRRPKVPGRPWRYLSDKTQ
jgi:hypothetical protein